MRSDFSDWLEAWFRKLKPSSFRDLKIDPGKTALVSVDMVKGFCSVGPLASPHIAAIIPEVTAVFRKCHKSGIKHFLLFQDTHHPETPEFSSYPPHCLRGSRESETVDELKSLPFSGQFTIFEKNSISPQYNTGFDGWLEKHPEIDTFIIVGNCTDLCVYFHAMHLRLSANAANLKRRIIVPEAAVQTYDMLVATAQKIGALPHDRILLHKIFLYHLSLNGIEVVASLDLKKSKRRGKSVYGLFNAVNATEKHIEEVFLSLKSLDKI
ncbi:MAG: nicotinamidase-like protein amidase [Candidatus Gottesmanbacteria bacterium GW2011_GWA2_43_14]|uniref:Nicotinamidase-like protein amidase n=1 Tax=Candidatus Gottesmanbacteria bacterium GW2011_GWA2_43_14 TaxID=1618443 RepID=A0A0G1DIU7_9BACT|nr:MAG: nicotinamidase-like protein amidase [Candidatus Gottesmanbacteria bacterium GW2011_GWA2_43_14]